MHVPSVNALALVKDVAHNADLQSLTVGCSCGDLQVRIFSLPQEWLWCETWCGNTTKHRAKTIDLCNNPLTKVRVDL